MLSKSTTLPISKIELSLIIHIMTALYKSGMQAMEMNQVEYMNSLLLSESEKEVNKHTDTYCQFFRHNVTKMDRIKSLLEYFMTLELDKVNELTLKKDHVNLIKDVSDMLFVDWVDNNDIPQDYFETLTKILSKL